MTPRQHPKNDQLHSVNRRGMQRQPKEAEQLGVKTDRLESSSMNPGGLPGQREREMNVVMILNRDRVHLKKGWAAGEAQDRKRRMLSWPRIIRGHPGGRSSLLRRPETLESHNQPLPSLILCSPRLVLIRIWPPRAGSPQGAGVLAGGHVYPVPLAVVFLVAN